MLSRYVLSRPSSSGCQPADSESDPEIVATRPCGASATPLNASPNNGKSRVHKLLAKGNIEPRDAANPRCKTRKGVII